MKNDRNCGMNNYPYFGMPMMQMPGMPNISMTPNMTNYQQPVNLNTNNDDINRLEQRINMLERRVSNLESNNNYSSNSYQML